MGTFTRLNRLKFAMREPALLQQSPAFQFSFHHRDQVPLDIPTHHEKPPRCLDPGPVGQLVRAGPATGALDLEGQKSAGGEAYLPVTGPLRGPVNDALPVVVAEHPHVGPDHNSPQALEIRDGRFGNLAFGGLLGRLAGRLFVLGVGVKQAHATPTSSSRVGWPPSCWTSGSIGATWTVTRDMWSWIAARPD